MYKVILAIALRFSAISCMEGHYTLTRCSVYASKIIFSTVAMFVDVGKNRPFLDQLPFSFVSTMQSWHMSTWHMAHGNGTWHMAHALAAIVIITMPLFHGKPQSCIVYTILMTNSGQVDEYWAVDGYGMSSIQGWIKGRGQNAMAAIGLIESHLDIIKDSMYSCISTTRLQQL